MLTKITVKDAEDKQVLAIEYDAAEMREVKVATKAGTIEIAVTEDGEGERR
jgi:hypothetical protein